MNSVKSIFPNISTEAFYNPTDQTITLRYITEKSLSSALNNISYGNMTVLQTYIHEICHWKDHHTTLWGINNLVKYYNALNARLNNDAYSFYYIPSYIKDEKLSLLTEYYHTIESNYDVIDHGKLWKWDTSIGLRFTYDGHFNDKAPILFINFRNPDTGERLSRIPISVSSILETKAMADEFLSNMHYLKEMGIMEREIELSIIKRKAMKWLYNPQLTLYSAIAHLSSCLSDRGDIIETLRFARDVANIALCMPEKHYDLLCVNNEFDAYMDRSDQLKKNRDIGFLLMNLIYNYRDACCDKTIYSINDLLNASNIPSLDILQNEVVEEFNNLKQSVIEGPLHNIMQKKLDNAISYFSNNGFDLNNFNSLSFVKYEAPRIICSDTKFGDNVIEENLFLKNCFFLQNISDYNWICHIDEIYKRVNIFNNICGI